MGIRLYITNAVAMAKFSLQKALNKKEDDLARLKKSLVKQTCDCYVDAMQAGDSFRVLTYKRDRGFSVHKLQDGTFNLKQWGHKGQTVEAESATKVKESLGVALKTEFPKNKFGYISR